MAWLFQVTADADGGLPRDQFANTFHLDENVAGAFDSLDATQLATDTIAAFRTNVYSLVANWKLHCKVYNLADAIPRPPHADVTVGTVTPDSTVPREVALCLSYYADRNLPHQRGRMYLPTAGWRSGLALRPATTDRNRALDLATAIAGLGGVDIDWVVWSPTQRVARKVTTAWCDDEWDTVRKRGLKSTSRSTRSTGA